MIIYGDSQAKYSVYDRGFWFTALEDFRISHNHYLNSRLRLPLPGVINR